MVNVGAEKTRLKLMIETGIQANVTQQATTNSNHSNHVTTSQARRVLELQKRTMSTKSLSQVNRKSD